MSNDLEQERFHNITQNIREAWKDVANSIVHFSLLMYEAFEGKSYKIKYNTWENYVESEFPFKRRQADYYRKAGEFIFEYRQYIDELVLEGFSQKDFLRLKREIDDIQDPNKKIAFIKKIFSVKNPEDKGKDINSTSGN